MSYFLWAGSALATTLIPLSPDEVSERASQVLVATLAGTTVWREPGSGLIRTDLALADVEVLRGDVAPDHLTFTGGELGELGMRVAGMPAWPIGQRVLLFVEGDGQSEACPVVGWGQGLYAVDPDGHLARSAGGWLAIDHSGGLLVVASELQATTLGRIRSTFTAVRR